jgi:hypothetical protein
MSQVAVTCCPEGIVVASESLLSYDRGRAHDLAQKVYPLGPRLAFAAVGNATMPDPRVHSDWPGFGAHLDTLTGGKPVEGDPLHVAERIGHFAVDVLQWLTDRPRGWEGLAIATWHVRYVVAGYDAEYRLGIATTWTATPAGAHEDGRISTDGKGKLALGVFDEWPSRRGRQIARSGAGGKLRPMPGSQPGDPPDPEERTLDRAEQAALRVVRLACRRFPGACGGPMQVLRIEPGQGLYWTDRPDWLSPA